VKITDLRILVHRRPTTIPLPGSGATVQEAVLSVHTDAGLAGHTFMSRPSPDVTDQLVNIVKPQLVGRDPGEIGAIWSLLGGRRDLDPTVQGYVDVVLWDIAGKAAGLPVHRLLGTSRMSLPAYASSWVLPGPDHYLEDALAFREQGLLGYKVHPSSMLSPPRSHAVRDVAIIGDILLYQVVRDAVGPDYPLFADPHFAYSYAQAIQVGKELERLDYEWFEDPLASDDIGGYVRLKQHLAIPILATELTGGGLRGLVPWAVRGATDFLRGDVVLKGGITGMLKIAHLAEAFHLNCELHDAYNAVNNLATVHLAMVIQNCSWFEVLVPHEPGVHDLTHLSWGLVEPIDIGRDGCVRPPQAPGLGIDVDWELIRHGMVAELS
jgi:L-alanine-DL-glutamate epimerase-like enolase superfamily enzyme